MKHSFWLMLTVLLFACGQQPPLQLEPIVAVELGINTSGTLTTSALLPNQNNPANSVAFTTDTFSVATNGNKKFLTAKFKVSNNSGAALENLTLVAYVQANNQTGTAIKDLQNFGGLSPSQLTSYAQSITPSHGMNVATPPTVNNAVADMQVFSESEVSSLTADASSLLQAGEYLLPYGYVARAATGTSRTIATGANTGFITVGIQVPNSNEPSSSLERFKMTFIAFTAPTAARVTQSLEEQSTPNAGSRKTAFAATDLMALGGSSSLSEKRECRVRVAGDALSPQTYLVDTVATSALSPAANGNAVLETSSINITTDRTVTALEAADIKVRGSWTGDYAGTWTGEGSSSLSFTPSVAFKRAEEITVTLPSGIKWCQPSSWGFRAAATLYPFSFVANYTKFDAATGNRPFAVAVGDFNNDAKLDAVTANNFSNTISVLLGTGNARLQAKLDTATGVAPTSVAVGDFNSDGKLDVVVTNSSSSANTISVLLGKGDGTFQAKTDYPTGSIPYWVAVGDLNNDSKLDLVIANNGGSSVSVLLGKGDGTFQAKTDFVTGSSPAFVALGDVNNDGRLDVMVVNNGNNSASVLLGNGDGTLQTRVNYTTGNQPLSVSLGDLNNDSKLDLVIANDTANSVSLLLGNGDGTFQTKTDFLVGNSPVATLGDVDGDKNLDVVTANALGNNISVLLGNGNGTFQARRDYSTGSTPYGIILGSFDGSGILDVVTANYNGNNVSVLVRF
jgi:hypothetical protein